MKTKLIALAAFTALANPAMAQETLIGPGVNNGDIEDGVAAPFAGVVGVASMAENHSAGGQYSVEIDLTANNGYQKWKALSDNPVITITDDTLNINHSVWVYIPMSATIANDCVLGLDIEYDDGTGFVTNKKIPGAYVGLNLQTAAKGVWHEVGVSDVDIPDNTIAVRTRPYNISTVDLVNGVDATAAAPADWVAAGYNGFLYLDDYSMTTTTPPDPSIIIQGDVANGNLENTTLAPWNPEGGAGSVDTLIFNGGAQSMSIDMAAPGKASRWRNMRNNRTAPAVAGDVIGTSIWFFIPSTTTFGTPTAKAIFNAELRSDRNMDATPGNGNLAGQLSVDLTSLPTDQWVQVTKLTNVTDGDQAVTEINTTGWNIETVDGADQAGMGYGGLIYIDDVELVNLGPGAVAAPGVLVDADKNNGDMEGTAWPAPWTTTDIDPWVVSGAGSASSTVNHTVGGGQSVEVDLTVNNSNGKWKQLHPNFETIPTTSNGYDRCDVSAWVYIPAATTFGAGGASLNLSIRNQLDGGGSMNMPGAPSINLATANRDEWIEVSVTGFDMTGTDALAINNWNIATVDTVNGQNAVNDATPADWIAEGYSGVIYLDDVYVRAYDSTAVDPITIDDTSWNAATDEFTIEYNTSFAGGVDVFYSDDKLSTWTADGNEPATGSGLSLVRTVTDPNRYYILAEPGTTPPDPNP